MSSISNILNQFPDLHQLSLNTPFAVKTQQFQAQAQISTNSNFSFLTAEGDRVSLSTGSEINASFGTYTFQGFAKGQAVDFLSQQLSTSEHSNFNLLIEGDLNEQEQADIQAFLEVAKNVLQEVSAGNVKKASDAALSLKELNSLASAALFFRQETTVSLKARSTQLATQGSQTSDESIPRGYNAPQGAGHTIENIIDTIRKAQEKFQIDPDTLSAQLPTLLATLIETLGQRLSKEEPPQSLFEQIRKEFFPSLLLAIQNRVTEPELTDKLTKEATKLETDNSAHQPPVESGEILANLLNE